jgi:hypothetical protein
MAPLERARYLALGWPAQAVRMAAWSSLEAVQHRLSGILGRRPSAGMVLADNEESVDRGRQPDSRG